ncbi:hypothetical protein [Alkalicoccobacillus murimartini]|uniref:Nitrogen fixation-related uncharacterized protein n=1 Tax=Alkalicoccobacillus murimartini TaxID=171685 RepID=A0ABT9YFD1_9BACI|nr:hypothetical protein [Alkalicoccobacillus murimartini]MDQ0206558.1 nitrogen fixation-related uncharacterized protein [Alkalicoccobacillus murimartini]
MTTAIIFGVAIFLGWIILDVVKHKKLQMETIVTSLVAGFVGAIFWFLLEWLF